MRASKRFHVYVMTNRPCSHVLYTGVTGNLSRRVFEHKNKLVPGFTSRYNLTRLVYYECFDAAIGREKEIKGWRRSKKIRLIESVNPHWHDLAESWTDIYKPHPNKILHPLDTPALIENTEPYGRGPRRRPNEAFAATPARNLLPLTLHVQVPSVREDRAVPAHKPTQKWQERIDNLRSSSIVALHTTFRCPTRVSVEKNGPHVPQFSSSTTYDFLTNHVILGRIQLIPPGAGMEITAQDPTLCTGGVDSAIFSDGHTEGDLRYVTLMHQQWLGLHQGILTSLPLLEHAANRETDRADLTKVADVLRRRIASIPNGTTDQQKWGERAVYVQLESLLRIPPESKEAKPENDEKSENAEKAQSDTGPLPLPIAEEVIDAKDTAPHYRAMASLLVAKLQEWKTALEQNLPPN